MDIISTAIDAHLVDPIPQTYQLMLSTVPRPSLSFRRVNMPSRLRFSTRSSQFDYKGLTLDPTANFTSSFERSGENRKQWTVPGMRLRLGSESFDVSNRQSTIRNSLMGSLADFMMLLLVLADASISQFELKHRMAFIFIFSLRITVGWLYVFFCRFPYCVVFED